MFLEFKTFTFYAEFIVIILILSLYTGDFNPNMYGQQIYLFIKNNVCPHTYTYYGDKCKVIRSVYHFRPSFYTLTLTDILWH
jgi:hypothetical protein